MLLSTALAGIRQTRSTFLAGSFPDQNDLAHGHIVNLANIRKSVDELMSKRR
jgi:hypothetical protein